MPRKRIVRRLRYDAWMHLWFWVMQAVLGVAFPAHEVSPIALRAARRL
ncbi:MAG TPA: hypothetical protein VMW48_12875 [Vicinamibacterales bacterium]|nr:hypothetical protein [Vicinamibacterales bacterium]